MKLITMWLAGAALVAATGAQAKAPATKPTQTFKIDAGSSYVKVTSNPTLCLGSCSLSAALAPSFADFTLAPGQSKTFDFATFTIAKGFGLGSADIDAQLVFSQPYGGATADAKGSVSYFRLGGFLSSGVSGGTLSWSDPVQQFTAANGSKFTVTFDDLTALKFGSRMTDRVTVRLDSVPAVPEPATWAMLLLGFGMVGAGLRYRRQATRVSVA